MRSRCVATCLRAESHELVDDTYETSATDQNYNFYSRQHVIRRKKVINVLDEHIGVIGGDEVRLGCGNLCVALFSSLVCVLRRK